MCLQWYKFVIFSLDSIAWIWKVVWHACCCTGCLGIALSNPSYWTCPQSCGWNRFNSVLSIPAILFQQLLCSLFKSHIFVCNNVLKMKYYYSIHFWGLLYVALLAIGLFFHDPGNTQITSVTVMKMLGTYSQFVYHRAMLVTAYCYACFVGDNGLHPLQNLGRWILNICLLAISSALLIFCVLVYIFCNLNTLWLL